MGNIHIIKDAALQIDLFLSLATAENHKFILVLPAWRI